VAPKLLLTPKLLLLKPRLLLLLLLLLLTTKLLLPPKQHPWQELRPTPNHPVAPHPRRYHSAGSRHFHSQHHLRRNHPTPTSPRRPKPINSKPHPHTALRGFKDTQKHKNLATTALATTTSRSDILRTWAHAHFLLPYVIGFIL
jgi:hypothetical protein